MTTAPVPILRAQALPSAQNTRAFFAWLLSALPRALAVEVIAWALCFGLLTVMLRGLKGRMKPGLMLLDDNVRAWAKTLRYRAEHPDATPETARAAAQVELQSQREVEAREDARQDALASDDPQARAQASEASAEAGAAVGSELQQSALALAESIARDQAFNRPLMSDGSELEPLDANGDGVISRAEIVASALSSEDGQERVPRTWFFRFWTNFASAPSLSTMSLAIPLLASHRAGGVSQGTALLSKALRGSFWARALAQNIGPVHLAAAASSGLSATALRAARVWTLPGLCYLGSMFLSFWLKRVFKRLRPQRKAGGFGHKLKDGSFPSGHSLTSFCFWAALTMSAAFAGAGAIPTLGLGLLSTTIVALTGLSRIYMGVHFPTDVLGGFFIGLVWCSLSLPALRWALHL